MPELIAPDPRVRRSFAAAMDEFRAEGRGSDDDHSIIGGYLRDRGAAFASDETFGRFVAAVRAVEVLADTIHAFPSTSRILNGLFADARRALDS